MIAESASTQFRAVNIYRQTKYSTLIFFSLKPQKLWFLENITLQLPIYKTCLSVPTMYYAIPFKFTRYFPNISKDPWASTAPLTRQNNLVDSVLARVRSLTGFYQF